MAALTDTFDLASLRLSSGEAASVDLDVQVDPLEFGGQRYSAAGDRVPAHLDVSRTTGSGFALRLRAAIPLDGPCMRCLENADATIDIDAREVDQPGAGDDLLSPYLEDQELNVRNWAHDALALALPTQIVCREDCAGLCPKCGENLNANPDHSHDPEPDPRWAKLSELKIPSTE
jgi:uncharacterized protein